MRYNDLINKTKSFNELCLINSFIDQCKDRNKEQPFLASLTSLSFTYLRQYIIYLEERDRLSSIDDDIIFDSIIHFQLELKKKNIEFNDFDSFLRIFTGETRDKVSDLIVEYIVPIVRKDLIKFIEIHNFENIIKFNKSDDQVGFSIEAISFFKVNYYNLLNDINQKISELNFNDLKTRPIFETLEEILKIMYNDDRSDISAMARIHLFGIAYGKELLELSGKDRREMVENATGGKTSLNTELSKGLSLSGLVSIDDTNLIPILKNSIYYDLEMERRKKMFIQVEDK